MCRMRCTTALLLALAAAAPALAQTADEADDTRTLQVTPSGHVQLDARSFPDWGEATESPRLGFTTWAVRRLRVGGDARWRGLRMELTVDPFDDDGLWVKDARLEVRPRPWLRLHAGQFKLPAGREYESSTRRLGFLERSVLSDSLAAARDLGAMVELRGPRRITFSVGAFAGDGLGREDRSGATTAARVEWTPLKDLSVALYGSAGRTSAGADDDPANGINARSSSGFRFFDRLYVQGTRTRAGGDVRWSPGRWRFDAEVLRFGDERAGQSSGYTDLPSLRGVGAVASVRWSGRRPSAGLRVERTSLDDTGTATGTGSTRPRATDVRARGITAMTASTGWTVSPWLRLLGDTTTEWFHESTTAPSPGRRGPYVSLGLRLQLELP